MAELTSSNSHSPGPTWTETARKKRIQLYGFRFRLWPIVSAVFLMQALLLLGREPARWLWRHGPADWAHRPWIFVALATAFQSLVGLGAIAVMRRVLPRADAHLRLPPKGQAMIGTAVLIGIGMALVMLLADYWPQILNGVAPTDYPVDALDSSGWLFAMGISGLAEEPIFRGLLMGGLAVLVPGRLRIGRMDLPFSAYLVALLFGLAHWQSFIGRPFYMAAAQQVYAFAWGITYAWLMERSRSLVAPIIAHGVGDAFEVGLVMAMSAALA